MKNKFPFSLFREQFYLLLLPVFFILHGFTENYFLVPVSDAFILLLYYVGVILVLCLLSFLFFRSWKKASLFTFCIMAYHFFFGSIHDTAKKIFGSGFITSYNFILLFSLIVFVILFYFLKREKNSFNKVTRYLTLLFIIFCVIDAISLTQKALKKNKSTNELQAGLIPDKNPSRPDVYLIIADEYAGTKELKEVFHYDNSEFENALRSKGFHIIQDPGSNYNFTPFSVASILNFSYLPINDINHTTKDLHNAMDLIKKNQVCRFFSASDYTIINNSYFDLSAHPTEVIETFLPAKTTYITSQTFISRIIRDIAFNLITRFKIPWFIKKERYSNLNNNIRLFDETIHSIQKPSPKFSYTHLMMPHFPFYFDSSGKPNAYNTLFDYENKDMYLKYLQYSNKKFISLINEILENSKMPPIILFMSDHGFREKVENKYLFMNFCAIYLPDKKYEGFYNGMTGVNAFRVLLNTKFGQTLPLLKDTTFKLSD